MTDQEKFWREFGNYLKQIRDDLKLSQEGAARKVDLTRQQWNRLENGKSGTKRETVLMIAEKLGLDKKEALNKAGFDVPTEIVKRPPQTVAEFVAALEQLGVTEWKIPGEDLSKLPPEAFAQLLDLIETNIRVQLKKVA